MTTHTLRDLRSTMRRVADILRAGAKRKDDPAAWGVTAAEVETLYQSIVENSLHPAPLAWTSERPTNLPDWPESRSYFYREDVTAAGSPVIVWKRLNEEALVTEVGDNKSLPISLYNGEWLGPLTPASFLPREEDGPGDWALAFADALGMDSGYKVPIAPAGVADFIIEIKGRIRAATFEEAAGENMRNAAAQEILDLLPPSSEYMEGASAMSKVWAKLLKAKAAEARGAT